MFCARNRAKDQICISYNEDNITQPPLCLPAGNSSDFLFLGDCLTWYVEHTLAYTTEKSKVNFITLYEHQNYTCSQSMPASFAKCHTQHLHEVRLSEKTSALWRWGVREQQGLGRASNQSPVEGKWKEGELGEKHLSLQAPSREYLPRPSGIWSPIRGPCITRTGWHQTLYCAQVKASHTLRKRWPGWPQLSWQPTALSAADDVSGDMTRFSPPPLPPFPGTSLDIGLCLDYGFLASSLQFSLFPPLRATWGMSQAAINLWVTGTLS